MGIPNKILKVKEKKPRRKRVVKKSDKTVIIQRVNKIIELKILGLSRTEILQYTSEETEWNVSERQIDEYIKKASNIISESSSYEINEKIGEAILRLNDLFKNLVKIQDYKGALAVQKEIHVLLGLSVPQKIDHNVTMRDQIIELSEKEKRERLLKLASGNN